MIDFTQRTIAQLFKPEIIFIESIEGGGALGIFIQEVKG